MWRINHIHSDQPMCHIVTSYHIGIWLGKDYNLIKEYFKLLTYLKNEKAVDRSETSHLNS